jgi:uncharacterized protein YjbI with pentapeptide repeats
MTVEEILDALGATTPEDLLRDYQAGQRDFSRINLLRTELESAVTPGFRPDCVDDPNTHRSNPLWLDRRSWDGFDWDYEGRCASADFGDSLPPPVLAGSTLPGINLAGSYLYPVNLANADLSIADFRGAVLIDCDLSGTTLFKADFRGALLRSCSLAGADLSRARFERATLEFCDLRECNLHRTIFSLARFSGVDLRGTSIASARFLSLTLAGGLQINADQLGALLSTLGIFVEKDA